jgi:hypothetical protein
MPVISALKGAKKKRMTQSSRFLDAALGGEAPDRRRACGEDHEAGNKPQGAGGERIAEIDQDELDEPRQVEGEVGLGTGRIAESGT